MSKQFKIVIDAGHGGHDSGAVNGTTGTREKDVVLADSLLLGNLLSEAGITVVQTRTDDSFLSLSNRAMIANHSGAPLISLHCNASNSKGHGFEAFTSPGQTDSDLLATMMLEGYAEKVAEQHGLRARYDLRDGDPDKEARFTVLTKTKREAVLFELGFIDNAHDVKFLTSEQARQTRCRVLAEAIINWATEVHGWKPNVPKMAAKDKTDGADSVLLLKNRVKDLEVENADLKKENAEQSEWIMTQAKQIDMARKALG